MDSNLLSALTHWMWEDDAEIVGSSVVQFAASEHFLHCVRVCFVKFHFKVTVCYFDLRPPYMKTWLISSNKQIKRAFTYFLIKPTLRTHNQLLQIGVSVTESHSPCRTPSAADCEENLSPPAEPWNTQTVRLSEQRGGGRRHGDGLQVPVMSQRSHVHVHRRGVRSWSALQPITTQTEWACDHQRVTSGRHGGQFSSFKALEGFSVSGLDRGGSTCFLLTDKWWSDLEANFWNATKRTRLVLNCFGANKRAYVKFSSARSRCS